MRVYIELWNNRAPDTAPFEMAIRDENEPDGYRWYVEVGTADDLWRLYDEAARRHQSRWSDGDTTPAAIFLTRTFSGFPLLDIRMEDD